MKEFFVGLMIPLLSIDVTAQARKCPPEAILEARCHQVPEQQMQPLPEKKKQKRVVAVGEFMPGEGCLAGFRRLGYTVTVAQCQKAAKESSLGVLWVEDPKKPSQPDTLVVDVQPGEPFVVLEARGVKATKIKLYKRPKSPS